MKKRWKNFLRWLFEYGKRDIKSAIKKVANQEILNEREFNAYNDHSGLIHREAKKLKKKTN